MTININAERAIIAWMNRVDGLATVESLHERLDDLVSELHEADFSSKDAMAVGDIAGEIGVLMTRLCDKHGLSFGVAMTRAYNSRDETAAASRADADEAPTEWSRLREDDDEMDAIMTNLASRLKEMNRADLVRLQRMIGAYYGSESRRLDAVLDALQDAFELERRRRREKGEWS